MTTTHGERTLTGWTANDSSFGARLALIRQRMKWGNVKEAAVACGLPVESWRTWERDSVTPRRIVEIASVIADRTGCDYIWLLTGNGGGQNGTQGGTRVTVAYPHRATTRPPGRASTDRRPQLRHRYA